MTTQHTPDQIHDLANKLERDPSEWGGLALGWKAAFHLRELQARIADLEAQLYAIGAGGVGASIQPQAQPDTAPAAWAILSDDGTAIRLWSKDKATAQEAADKHGRPLVPLYTAPQPTRQPLPADTYTALAHRIATKYAHRSDPAFCGYAFLPHTLEQFVRAIEQAHNITGGQ